MNPITLDYASCVLTTNRSAGCTRCADICPAEVITISEEGLSYRPADCIACGACQGVCPTESFRIEGFSHENFTTAFVQSDDPLLSCKKNVPCLAALNGEYLISLALEKRSDIILDTGHCEGCELSFHVMGHIETSVNEANHFLESFGIESRAVLEATRYEGESEKNTKELSRRDLLSKFSVKEAYRAKLQFDKRVEASMEEVVTAGSGDYSRAKVKEKQLPFRRALFVEATRRLEGDPEAVLEASTMPFITAKSIDKKSCTNCGICYHICPTGALLGEKFGGKIAFDFLKCVACNSCHDSCTEHCLHKRDEFTKGMFTEPKRERLATFFMRQCPDCGMPFVNDGNDVCPRCRSLDDEARELAGF